MIVSSDTDNEFVAMNLVNQSDSKNTDGFVSLKFDLEDTEGVADLYGTKISTKKDSRF